MTGSRSPTKGNAVTDLGEEGSSAAGPTTFTWLMGSPERAPTRAPEVLTLDGLGAP